MVDGDRKCIEWEDYTNGEGDYTQGLTTIQSPLSCSSDFSSPCLSLSLPLSYTHTQT